MRLKDTAEAVARIVAEKAAGRDRGGSVDLVWINGANFLALKEHVLLYGPFATRLPNYRFVDTTHLRSNVVDFTVPVDGYEAPWRRAQIVFVVDSACRRSAALDVRGSSGPSAIREGQPTRRYRTFLGRRSSNRHSTK